MFFHFQLTPLEEVRPWGQKDEPVLHWFGLSDGQYWMHIGETEIFRYSNKFLAAYPPDDPALTMHHCHLPINYYVVRLWEDILEILPDILDPLPAPLLQRMQPIDEWLQWCQKVDRWCEDLTELCSDETLDARRDMHTEALEWWGSRHMYTGPFKFQPGIRFWNDGQFVHCLWDSRKSKSDDDHFIWDAVFGTASVPVTVFIDAVSSFNTRFIAAMTERVETILAGWPHPAITLDLDQLTQENIQRAEHFVRCMDEIQTRAKTATEWESILETIQAIENDPDFLTISVEPDHERK